MPAVDKEDLVIIATLTVLLVVGWYIIFLNFRSERRIECLERWQGDVFGITKIFCQPEK